MRKEMKFKLGELFCGPGGLAWGAIHAEIENKKYSITHKWSNDYDLDTCNTYIHNICPTEPKSVYTADIRNFNLNELSSINSFAFGFPCNDYSQVGEHKGMDGNFGPLYKYGVEVLDKFNPLWFLAENVSGLQSANEGTAFKNILKELRKAGKHGYKLYPHLYKFEEYGIPQTRHRVIIVGIRNDLPYEYSPPSPQKYKDIDNTCKRALELPPISENAFNNEKTKQSKTVVERLTYIKPGQNAFNAELPEHLKLKIKGAKISHIYKRLDPNKPAYTVTGSGGGGTHMYHYNEPRALTNRERARLQTFPDDYLFIGSKESVRKQIGMAVPPQAAKIIFESILNTFAQIPYDSVECNIKIGDMDDELLVGNKTSKKIK